MKKLFLITIIFLTINGCSDEDSFSIKYILKVENTNGGKTNAVENSYDEGTNITVTAIPENNYKFIRWEIIGNNSSEENPLELTMNGNKFLTPIFSGLRVSNITISPKSLQLELGKTSNLSVDILPITATDKTYTWLIENPSIASINNQGVIEALSIGKTNITVISNDNGLTDTASITVIESPPTNSFLIDFGPNDTTNGNLTSSPDINDNYWNNFIDPSINSVINNIIDVKGVSSTFNIILNDEMRANGIVNGGLLAPEDSLLNDLAINTATQDYFFNYNTSSTITFSGLNIENGYSFKIFGSRNSTSTRITQYKINGFNKNGISNSSQGSLTTSGADIGLGNSSVNGNDSNVFNSEVVYPTNNGEITLEIEAITGGFAYVNLIKILEYGN
ncbi:Ig-like domain-containing protein [Polaribacter tangerinus]|uniref:Ig-like domain-containing protein n=1 Tax=Polaribacter tangerinus TaxID=1920034 RepID=UPI000B4B30E5|nr:Ig-like domain-containing protein [Polaribacter tangerinus]